MNSQALTNILLMALLIMLGTIWFRIELGWLPNNVLVATGYKDDSTTAAVKALKQQHMNELLEAAKQGGE